jgi:cyclase
MLYFGRGHTNGDTVIFFPDLRTVHAGDLVIDGMPVIDYDNGGSALEFVATLEKLMTLDFDTVIPGHGRVLTKDDVRAYIPKLKTMNDRMRELARRKVPDDQLAAQLKLDDIGWAHTVSTGTFMRSIVRYRDEVAASRP